MIKISRITSLYILFVITNSNFVFAADNVPNCNLQDLESGDVAFNCTGARKYNYVDVHIKGSKIDSLLNYRVADEREKYSFVTGQNNLIGIPKFFKGDKIEYYFTYKTSNDAQLDSPMISHTFSLGTPDPGKDPVPNPVPPIDPHRPQAPNCTVTDKSSGIVDFDCRSDNASHYAFVDLHIFSVKQIQQNFRIADNTNHFTFALASGALSSIKPLSKGEKLTYWFTYADNKYAQDDSLHTTYVYQGSDPHDNPPPNDDPPKDIGDNPPTHSEPREDKITYYNNLFYLRSDYMLQQQPGHDATWSVGDNNSYLGENISGKVIPGFNTGFNIYTIGRSDDPAHPSGSGHIDFEISYDFDGKGAWDRIENYSVDTSNCEGICLDNEEVHINQFINTDHLISFTVKGSAYKDLHGGRVELKILSINNELRLDARLQQLNVSQLILPYKFSGGEVVDVSNINNRESAEYPDTVSCLYSKRPCQAAEKEYDESNKMSDASMKEILQENSSQMQAFRTGVKERHGSCASCHASDGYDLARFAYTDDDIKRRALDHVDENDANNIIRLVHALRKKYGLEDKLLDPDNFRPMQPGQEVLGATANDPGTPVSRDLAFGNELQNLEVNSAKLLLMNSTIVSLEQAIKASAQIKAIDLRKLKIGQPFNRWGEDIYYQPNGSAHAGDAFTITGAVDTQGHKGSMAKWMPFMGIKAKPGLEKQWQRLQNDYNTVSSDYNFWKMYDSIDKMTTSVEDKYSENSGLAFDFMKLKYKSVLIYTHMLKYSTIDYPNRLIDEPGDDLVSSREVLLARSPMWLAADVIRRHPLNCNASDLCTTFPDYVQLTFPQDMQAQNEETEAFKRSWFWMSWMYDPALLYADQSLRSISGDYFYAINFPHYQMHYAFILAKMSVEKATADPKWITASGRGVAGHGKWASIRTFMVFKNSEYGISNYLAHDERRALQIKWMANMVRMWIYMVDYDLDTSNSVYSKQATYDAVRYALSWLDTFNGADNADDTAKFTNIVKLMRPKFCRAKELKEQGDFDSDLYPEITLTPDPVCAS